jgi:hypothetical protein
MEGTHCFNPESGCDSKGLEMPVADYGRDEGICVTGGYVYRGKKYPGLAGKYLFGDWKGKMYYLEEKNGKWDRHPLKIEGKKDHDLGLNINSFGEDQDGELYILTQKFTGTFMRNGELYLIKGK